MIISRRNVIISSLGCGLVAAGSLTALAGVNDVRPETGPLIVDTDREPDELISLWPDGPPGGVPAGLETEIEERHTGELKDRAHQTVADPYMAVFRPAKPDGTALIIMPGGGYTRVVIDKEGYEGARWFSNAGMTVFVLFYRLPDQGWAAGPDTPLQDAQRALRIVRSLADKYGFATDRIAAMGFSAGGHLCGSLATHFDAVTYRPADAVDRLSARPDIAATIYPVVTMSLPYTHGASRDRMIGPDPSPSMVDAYSIEKNVSSNTPPLFIVHSTDDRAVPAENSFLLYQAARAADVAADLHVFPTGGHGFGLRIAQEHSTSAWPMLFDHWRQRHFTM